MPDNIIGNDDIGSDDNQSLRRYKNKHKKVQLTKELRRRKSFTKPSTGNSNDDLNFESKPDKSKK